jgi:hypothetical protein
VFLNRAFDHKYFSSISMMLQQWRDAPAELKDKARLSATRALLSSEPDVVSNAPAFFCKLFSIDLGGLRAAQALLAILGGDGAEYHAASVAAAIVAARELCSPSFFDQETYAVLASEFPPLFARLLELYRAADELPTGVALDLFETMSTLPRALPELYQAAGVLPGLVARTFFLFTICAGGALFDGMMALLFSLIEQPRGREGGDESPSPETQRIDPFLALPMHSPSPL